MDIFVVLAILWGIGVQIVRFFRWMNKQLGAANTAPSPVQQAIAQAQKQPRPTPARRPLRADASFSRRPDAGGSAVPQPATDDEFRAQIQQLEADEAAGARSPVFAADAQSPRPTAQSLFSNTDDFIRAIILQEALGPPLSRRPRNPIPHPAPDPQ